MMMCSPSGDVGVAGEQPPQFSVIRSANMTAIQQQRQQSDGDGDMASIFPSPAIQESCVQTSGGPMSPLTLNPLAYLQHSAPGNRSSILGYSPNYQLRQECHHQNSLVQQFSPQGAPQDYSPAWSQASSSANGGHKAFSLLDSHDRFKPERNNQRRPVARMKWGGGGGTPSPLGVVGGSWSGGSNMAGDLISCGSAGGGGISPASSMTPGGNSGDMGMMAGYFGQYNQSRVQSHQFHSRASLPMESESRVASMTIADISPRIALKKVLLLYEHCQYSEAASFIDRLSITTFRIILREIPIDIFIEAVPLSLPILESLFSKVFASEGGGSTGGGGYLKCLKPYSVLMHIISFFSRDLANQELRARNPSDKFLDFLANCRKILRVMVVGEPVLVKTVQQRARALDKAVEGMGHHSLVGTEDESLVPLHDALKVEFRRVVDTYKEALQKLEEMALLSQKNGGRGSLAHGRAPVAASHQRQLSLRVDEIQERLIKNKSLLNVVEPTMDNHCLDVLLGILERRIGLDKDTLFQFTQLRKEAGEEGQGGDAVVAPLLMRYSRASKKVLEMMREAATEAGTCLDHFEDDSSDLSGYHSDSDSAIMTSGNSPFVTPRARYNFLSRSVRSKQHLRPSLLGSSVASHTGRSLSTGSAPESSSALSSLDSGSCSLMTTPHPQQPHLNYKAINHDDHCGGTPGTGTTATTTPTRPRHVKHKNQLQKNSSAMSSCSINSDSCSSGCSVGSSSPENSSYHGGVGEGEKDKAADTISMLSGCVECVTLVSVPDNQVITQGVNHQCANPNHGRKGGASEGGSGGQVVSQLRAEVNQLRGNLRLANAKILELDGKGGGAGGGAGVKVHNKPAQVGTQEERKQFLVREYGALYAQGRVETMDALDALPELGEADELKSKLLFSVIVLAFRAVQTSLAEIKEQVSTLLQLEPQLEGKPHGLNGSQEKLIQALSEYLHNCQRKIDHSRCVDVVANQLWSTLYDYPCLKSCQSLLKYIRTCVNLAWGLSNLNPPCLLEYERKVFCRDMHVRFHNSDNSLDCIKSYLWPALMEESGGNCVHKGIVIT